MPKQIVRTRHDSSVKEEIVVPEDTNTKCKTVESVTMAKQTPTTTLLISKKTSVKMKDASFDPSHDANSSFNILTQKEREVKRKINKISCFSKRSHSCIERNKSNPKSLQCLPISAQSWLRKGKLMPTAAQILQCNKAPGSPCLNNSHQHQISSKVQTKVEGDIIKNRLTSNAKSHSYISNINYSPIPLDSRSNSTNDFSALKYSDMFQEINPIDKGPGIYEMFSSPLYRAMRKFATCETSDQTVLTVPQRKGLTCKLSKTNQAAKKNNVMNIKDKMNSKRENLDIGVKKKKKNAEEIKFLFKSDKGQKNEQISAHDCHTRTSRNEVLIHNIESQEVSGSGHLSDSSELCIPLPVYEVHLDDQCLSIIVEDVFEQTSVKPVYSEGHENALKDQFGGSVDGGNPADHSRTSMLPNIKNTDYSGINLFELEQSLNKKDEADVKSAIEDLVGTTVAQESTAVLSNGPGSYLVGNEAEHNVLCTEDQDNTTYCGSKAASHSYSDQTSFAVQPLINIWTVEKTSPLFQFESVKEDNLADELLHCLTSALLLEENNTDDSTTLIATNVQAKECHDKIDNVSENTNVKMPYEKSFQVNDF